MGWKHFQTVEPPPPPLSKESPKLVGGLFGIRLLILHIKFQFSKSIKSSTSHIFLNLTYSFSFPTFPKIVQKFTQNRQTAVIEISIDI